MPSKKQTNLEVARLDEGKAEDGVIEDEDQDSNEKKRCDVDTPN